MNAIENLEDIHSELLQPSRAEQSGSSANQISPTTVSRGVLPTLFNAEGKISIHSVYRQLGSVEKIRFRQRGKFMVDKIKYL